jgi:hypothetical protein
MGAVLGAAVTIWMLFSVWLLCPHIGVPRRMAQIVGLALAAELILLLVWSYGTEACDDRACAPLAQAAGVAARIDLPVLSLVLVPAVLRTTTARRAGGPSDVPEVSRRG